MRTLYGRLQIYENALWQIINIKENFTAENKYMRMLYGREPIYENA